MNEFEIKERLDLSPNGVRIYSYPNPVLHGFCLCLYVLGGSIYETDGENGITHLVEHLVFRNANRVKNDRFYELLDSLGLEFNACTYKEFVRFTLTGASAHFGDACELMCLLLSGFGLSAEQVALEKKRVRAEIREADDKNSLEFFSAGLVWENSGPARLISGTASGIGRLGVRRLEQFRRELFSPANMFFFVTGGFPEDGCRTLARLVGEKRLFDAPAKDNAVAVPAGFSKRGALVKIKRSPGHFCRFSFDVDMSAVRLPVLYLLYDVLFSGENCRLFRKLCEDTGLVYSYDARLECYKNVGTVSFSYEVKPGDILRTVSVCAQVIREVKADLGGALALVLPGYTDNAGLLLDSPDDLNWARGYNGHILGEFYPDEASRSRAYSQVGEREVLEAARRVLVPDNLVFTLKTDAKKPTSQEIFSVLSQI